MGRIETITDRNLLLMEKLYWAVIIPTPSEKVIFEMEIFDLEEEADARLKELKDTAYKVLMRGEQE